MTSSRVDLFLASQEDSDEENKPLLNIDPENVRQSLAKLVLLLIDILRQALEREAVRRMERGTLTPEEIERVGSALMRVKEELEKLKEEHKRVQREYTKLNESYKKAKDELDKRKTEGTEAPRVEE